MHGNSALIIVDYQYDFLPGGALGVPEGDQAFLLLVNLLDDVDIIVFTRDWHPADHFSFSPQPEYRDGSWPQHCVFGSHGADIDEDLWDIAMTTGKPIILVHKGFDRQVEAYSGFDGVVVDVFNDDLLRDNLDGATLAQALTSLSVRKVKIGGLALDYCVKATALDCPIKDKAVYLNATRPVGFLTGAQAIIDLMQGGVRLNGTVE